MPIKKIRNKNVSDLVFDQMLSLVVSGEWRAGEQIPTEEKLSEEFDVSRITVRTTLSKLESLGIIEKVRGKGTFVRAVDGGDIVSLISPLLSLCSYSYADINAFRRAFEPAFVGLAIERQTPEDVERLRAIKAQMDASLEAGDYLSYLKHDAAFHEAVVRMTHSDFARDIYSIAEEAIRVNFLKANQQELQDDGESALPRRQVEGHGALLKAIENRDVEAARAILTEHLSFQYPDSR